MLTQLAVPSARPNLFPHFLPTMVAAKPKFPGALCRKSIGFALAKSQKKHPKCAQHVRMLPYLTTKEIQARKAYDQLYILICENDLNYKPFDRSKIREFKNVAIFAWLYTET